MAYRVKLPPEDDRDQLRESRLPALPKTGDSGDAMIGPAQSLPAKSRVRLLARFVRAFQMASGWSDTNREPHPFSFSFFPLLMTWISSSGTIFTSSTHGSIVLCKSAVGIPYSRFSASWRKPVWSWLSRRPVARTTRRV